MIGSTSTAADSGFVSTSSMPAGSSIGSIFHPAVDSPEGDDVCIAATGSATASSSVAADAISSVGAGDVASSGAEASTMLVISDAAVSAAMSASGATARTVAFLQSCPSVHRRHQRTGAVVDAWRFEADVAHRWLEAKNLSAPWLGRCQSLPLIGSLTGAKYPISAHYPDWTPGFRPLPVQPPVLAGRIR